LTKLLEFVRATHPPQIKEKGHSYSIEICIKTYMQYVSKIISMFCYTNGDQN